ncbi:hypothetical protein RRG08_060100 [Elysia crispata]|uniref:Uncharacterized protein n=1 Tax=Elysia crispata TaxID=231223 RepID=A0AAE0YZ51_9GAST|nr:hypothetical protein RRG08_060100 [Elysia crispata]
METHEICMSSTVARDQRAFPRAYFPLLAHSHHVYAKVNKLVTVHFSRDTPMHCDGSEQTWRQFTSHEILQCTVTEVNKLVTVHFSRDTPMHCDGSEQTCDSSLLTRYSNAL